MRGDGLGGAGILARAAADLALALAGEPRPEGNEMVDDVVERMKKLADDIRAKQEDKP